MLASGRVNSITYCELVVGCWRTLTHSRYSEAASMLVKSRRYQIDLNCAGLSTAGVSAYGNWSAA